MPYRSSSRPTPRLDYQNGVFNNGYVAYCAADAAWRRQATPPFIDLQTMALAYYTAIGITRSTDDNSLGLSGQPNVLHFQAHGAYERPGWWPLGVQALNLPISQFVNSGQIGRRLAERFAGRAKLIRPAG